MHFTITEARNPQWVDSNHNKIDLEVNFAELEEEWLPYTASPDDVCEHSRTLYSKAVAGDYGQVSDEYTITLKMTYGHLLHKLRPSCQKKHWFRFFLRKEYYLMKMLTTFLLIGRFLLVSRDQLKMVLILHSTVHNSVEI